MEIQYKNDVITPEELIRTLVLNGQFSSVIREPIRRKEVRKKAEELGISVNNGDLQETADQYRERVGLHSSDQTFRFLERYGLEVEDLESYCETSLLEEQVKRHLAGQEDIEEYFVNNRAEFNRVRISIIDVEKEGMAREMKHQVENDDARFHQLAREHSIDENTRYDGGHMGWLRRNDLEAGLRKKVFNADAGSVLGPIEGPDGYRLLLVEETRSAELTDDVKEEIMEQIFWDWLESTAGSDVSIDS